MRKIYLNLKKTEICRCSGGHRSSDGWVNCYITDIDYSLTSSSADAMLPLKACSILDCFFAKYSGSHDYENDRYSCIDEYDHVSNIDIAALINDLNSAQCKYEFVQSTEPLEYNASWLVFRSRQDDIKAQQIINNCNAEVEQQIKALQKQNRAEILAQTFPHIKNLIIEDQLDFFSKYEKVDYYPLDLLAVNNEYDLLITNILKYKKPPFEKFNDVYTLLTTGAISYFDILKGTVPQLDESENLILSEFLIEIEKRYRHNSYDSILSSFSTSHLKGLCNLYGHLLDKSGINKCYAMIDWRENHSLPENQRSIFSFHSRYLFPYFIIVLLSEGNIIKESFFDKYRYEAGFHDIPLILDKRSIYFKELIPYFKKIIQNQNAIEILALILHISNIEQYTRNQINNKELLSCKGNKEACIDFVKNTLQKFITAE